MIEVYEVVGRINVIVEGELEDGTLVLTYEEAMELRQKLQKVIDEY